MWGSPSEHPYALHFLGGLRHDLNPCSRSPHSIFKQNVELQTQFGKNLWRLLLWMLGGLKRRVVSLWGGLSGWLQVREISEKSWKWKVVREIRKIPELVREVLRFVLVNVNQQKIALFQYQVFRVPKSSVDWTAINQTVVSFSSRAFHHNYFQNLILRYVRSTLGQSIPWMSSAVIYSARIYLVVITQWKLYLN